MSNVQDFSWAFWIKLGNICHEIARMLSLVVEAVFNFTVQKITLLKFSLLPGKYIHWISVDRQESDGSLPNSGGTGTVMEASD